MKSSQIVEQREYRSTIENNKMTERNHTEETYYLGTEFIVAGNS
jgi:hypothetical protein